MAVMELIDHLYGCLLALLALANRTPPPACPCITTTEPLCEDPPSPIDFNLATVLTLAAELQLNLSDSASECACSIGKDAFALVK